MVTDSQPSSSATNSSPRNETPFFENDSTNETSENVQETSANFENFLSDFKDTILRHLKDDPQHFQPAVQKFIKNYQTNAKNPLHLQSLLHTSFKHMHYSGVSKQGTIRKGKKISVQPTAISRRKSNYSGKIIIII